MKESPFKLWRTGWGTFVVKAEITFKHPYKKGKCSAAHALDFDYHASITSIDLESDKKVTDYDYNWSSMDTYEFEKEQDYPDIDPK